MRVLRLCAWLGIVAAGGVAIGFAAAAVQRVGFSPVLILSLLLGGALGAAAVGAATVFRVHPRALILGTLFASVVLVFSQHFGLYQTYVAGWQQAQVEQPELALFRNAPPGFFEYLRRESAGGRVWLWLLDAAVVTVTAAWVVVRATKALPALRPACGEVTME